ncbi:SMI1/KNR4 family protein [Pseudoduganella lutea]|uniref:Knr4/Smi1-like domain-containing protein n=1 Tax=Pseudoduganella lutea TaxID=321985 RepID=A0A4P6L2G3_9BURK|nr:SMI1/KNR4 family protein [Pseudoduganella lutea]QBE65607.1 hypothetical protein EWM63_23610 [Pseudoduganella lutea]
MSPSLLTLLDEMRTLEQRSGTPAGGLWYKRFPVETAASLAAVEQSTGFPVPSDLKDLLLSFGGFYFPMHVAGFTVTFHGVSPYPRPFGGLADLLDARWCWGDYRDDEDFPEDAIARLNTNFVCFGHCDVDEDSADHFFYDRSGNFGVLRFDQEFRDRDAIDYLYELCEGTNRRAPLALDEVLTQPLRYCLWGEPDDDLE